MSAKRPARRWLLALLLLAVVVTAALPSIERSCQSAVDGVLCTAGEYFGFLSVLVLPPLFLLLTYLAARLGLEFGKATRPKGELDRLLAGKRLGLLSRGWQRIRNRAAGDEQDVSAAGLPPTGAEV